MCLCAIKYVDLTTISDITILSFSKDIVLVNCSREDSAKTEVTKVSVEQITVSSPNSLNTSTFFGLLTMQMHFFTPNCLRACKQPT